MIFGLLLVPPLAVAAEYHADAANGNDGTAGTQSRPEGVCTATSSIEKDAVHVHFEGLTVQGQEHAFEFMAGAGHIAVKDCRLLGGRFNVVLRSSDDAPDTWSRREFASRRTCTMWRCEELDMHGAKFDPAEPQEVYNNIIVQIADYPVSAEARVADGSQIFDGNLYHRIPTAAKQPFLREWSAGGSGGRDFRSLTEFKRSPLFAESKRIHAPGFANSGLAADPGLDRDYRPAANGPAATGAVPLPAHWPANRGERFRGALPPAEPTR